MKRKEKIQFLLICVMAAVIVVALWFQDRNEKKDGRRWITRPESGAEKQNIALSIGDVTKELALSVEPRKKTEDEVEAAFEKSRELLEKSLNPKGEKEILVTETLMLPQYLSETGVSIRWDSSKEEVLSKSGTIKREGLEEICEISLVAGMSLEEAYTEIVFSVKVLPYAAKSKEALFYEAEKALKKLEEETVGEEGFLLPEEICGVTVERSKKKVSIIAVLAAVGLLLPVVIFFAKQQEKDKERLKREEALLSAYPQLITKLTLYTGAGLSLRGAWERLAADCRKRMVENGKKDAACEEVLILAGELQNGASEAKAYEAFGRRTGQKPYLRCAALLTSGLQKGSGRLKEGLEAEVRMAWEAHRERVTRKGEEAQTKLLFPMMGMLLLVMAVVMIPAFFSM